MNLKTYLLHQKEEIEKYKWIESQKAGRDLGEQAVHDWIAKFASKYREEYEFIFSELIKETVNYSKDDLKKKFPEVSDELWEHIFTEVIKKFTEVWTKNIVETKNIKKKKHLEEI
jgi:hypothetical protein